MKTLHYSALLLFLLTINLSLTNKIFAQTNNEQIKLGAILPLSGSLGLIGKEIQKGMKIANEELNNKKIEIIYEDNQDFNRKTSVSALNKLIHVDKVVTVFDAVVNTITALSPILNKNNIPGIVVWDSNKKIANLGEYIYAIGFSTELAGKDMAEHAVKKLNSKKVAVISAHDEWSEIIANSFIEKYKSLNSEIALHEEVDFNTTDFKTIATKIKLQNIDSVYIPLFPDSVVAFVRQLKAVNFNGNIMTGDAVSINEISELGSDSEGIYITQI